MDASKLLPSKEMQLETKDTTYFHFKTEVFKGLISYSTSPNFAANLVTITAERAKEVIMLNKRGQKPDRLDEIQTSDKKQNEYDNVVGQDSLTRFDVKKKNVSGQNQPGSNRSPKHKNENSRNVSFKKK
jgi:hypothetical protein